MTDKELAKIMNEIDARFIGLTFDDIEIILATLAAKCMANYVDDDARTKFLSVFFEMMVNTASEILTSEKGTLQ